MADDRFGRIALQTRTNEAYTLDLYEAEDIICRGFYLPPPPPLGLPLPPEIPSEVEFAAPADVWDLLVDSLSPRGVRDELRHYTLADPEVSNNRFYVDMATALAAERREAEVWTGHVRAGLGEFTFVLEQYGSPEIELPCSSSASCSSPTNTLASMPLNATAGPPRPAAKGGSGQCMLPGG